MYRESSGAALPVRSGWVRRSRSTSSRASCRFRSSAAKECAASRAAGGAAPGRTCSRWSRRRPPLPWPAGMRGSSPPGSPARPAAAPRPPGSRGRTARWSRGPSLPGSRPIFGEAPGDAWQTSVAILAAYMRVVNYARVGAQFGVGSRPGAGLRGQAPESGPAGQGYPEPRADRAHEDMASTERDKLIVRVSETQGCGWANW